jgi:hypothetical protein
VNYYALGVYVQVPCQCMSVPCQCHVNDGYRNLHGRKDTQCTYQHNIEVRPCNHSCSGKAMSITKPACVCIAHAPIVTCGLPRSTMFFHIISQTVRLSKKKVTEHKIFVLIYDKFLILRRNKLDMIKHVNWSSCKVPFILVRFLKKTLFFPACFRKIVKYQILLKYVRWETSCSMRMGGDRRTDMTKLIVVFAILRTSLKNSSLLHTIIVDLFVTSHEPRQVTCYTFS